MCHHHRAPVFHPMGDGFVTKALLYPIDLVEEEEHLTYFDAISWMMPHKYLNQKGIEIRKQRYKLTNWPAYNESLRRRGDIDVWLSEEVIANWTKEDRVYDGTGAPDLYTDIAIIACHEIRKVFRQPLRQSQGFIDSLFRKMGLTLSCPDYSILSRRLKRLGLKCPRYRKTDRPDDNLAAIAIDSTGLKRFGRNEAGESCTSLWMDTILYKAVNSLIDSHMTLK